eukprot:1030209-Pleurochrysis_carterae.AAC.3
MTDAYWMCICSRHFWTNERIVMVPVLSLTAAGTYLPTLSILGDSTVRATRFGRLTPRGWGAKFCDGIQIVAKKAPSVATCFVIYGHECDSWTAT